MSSWKLIYLITALTLQAQPSVAPQGSVPLYQVTVVQSSAKAMDYSRLNSDTSIGFTGTVLAPTAKGEARVASKAKATQIKARFEGLPAASGFGSEYLTYVLWAVSPEGRATNLGEILLTNGRGSLKVTEPLQSFALVVTAEPYFAVTQPSEVVVLENAMVKSTDAQVALVDAKFSLLRRGQYHMATKPGAPVVMDKKTPFVVYQAQNAVDIASAAGAQTYAPDAFAKAQQQLAQAVAVGGSEKDRTKAAREAVQSAEDARLITVKAQDAERVETERKQAQAKIDQAKIEAAEAEAAKAAADRSRLVAQQENANLKNEAVVSAAALATADSSRQAAMQENTDLRERLREQLNAVLQTRATARGLIVNMSGVTFKTNEATLLPIAREKLSKIAGIILAHPGLKLECEGYTDNQGGDELNQRLSEKRAQSARDFLVTQGISPDAITNRGLGKASPIDTNDTAAGRLNNRRVELVVSGAGITTGTTR